MKKRLFKKVLAAVLTAALLLSSNGVAPINASAAEKVYVEGVYTNFQKATMISGTTKQISVYVEPANATVQRMSYKSSNEKVTKVSKTGLVTAVAPGNATITIKALDGSSQKEIVKIKVLQDLKITKSSVDADNEVIVMDKTYGNVTIDASVGDADIYFSGVTIKGLFTLAGGEEYTVNMYDSTANKVVIDEAAATGIVSLAETEDSSTPTLFLGDNTTIAELSARVSAAIRQGDGSEIQNLNFVQDDNGTIRVFLEGYTGTLAIDSSLGNIELVASGCNLADVAVNGGSNAGSVQFTNAGDSAIDNLTLKGAAKVDLVIPATKVQIDPTANGSSLTTRETVGTIVNGGTESSINVVGSVDNYESSGAKAILDVKAGGSVTTVNLTGGANIVKGEGAVAEVTVNAPSCSINTINTLVTVGEVSGTKVQGTEARANTSATSEPPRNNTGAPAPAGPTYVVGQELLINNFEDSRNLLSSIQGSLIMSVVDGGNGSSKALEVSGKTAAWNGVGISLARYLNKFITVRVRADIKCEVAGTYKATVATGGAWPNVASVTGEANTWCTLDGTFVLGANITQADLYFETPNATGGYYLDNVSVTIEAIGEPIPVTGVTLDKGTIALDIGQTDTLTATVAPANADIKGVEWSSSNTAVATVSNVGFVEAKGAGSAIITAKTVDGNKTATCTVTVTNNVVLALDQSTIVLQSVGANKTVTANAPGVIWETQNSAIATVNNGVITAAGFGSTTVTATLGATTVTCNVVVSADPFLCFDDVAVNTAYTMLGWGTNGTAKIVAEEGNAANRVLEVSPANYNCAPVLTITLPEGKTLGDYSAITYKALWKQGDVGYKDITAEADATLSGAFANVASRVIGSYTRSAGATTSFQTETITLNDAKASLSGTIQIALGINCAATGSGNATVYYLDDISLVKKPDVTPVAITGVTLNKDTTTLNISENETLTATIAPSTATTSKTLTWSSSDEAVATVDSTGKVTAVSAGSATITVTTAINGVSTAAYTDTCTVTVNAVVAMKLNRTNVVFATTGSSIVLTSNKPSTTWSSSDASKVTVAADGTITAVADGTAVITATAGSMTATCTVLVNTKAVMVEDFEDGDLDEWIPKYCTGTVKGSADSILAFDGDKCIQVTTADVYNGLEYSITNNSGSAKQYVVSAYVKNAGTGTLSMVIKQEGGSYTTYATKDNVGTEWVLLDNSTATKIDVANGATVVVRVKATTAASFYVDNLVITDVTPVASLVTTLTNNTATYGVSFNGTPVTGLSLDGVNNVVAVSGSSITANTYKVASVYLDESYIGKTISVTAKVRRSGGAGNLAWQMNSGSVNVAAQWGAAVDTWFTVSGTAVVTQAGELYMTTDNSGPSVYYVADLVITATAP